MRVLLEIPPTILQAVDAAVAQNKMARATYTGAQPGHIEEANRIRREQGQEAADVYISNVVTPPPAISRTMLLKELMLKGFEGWAAPVTPEPPAPPPTAAERRERAVARLRSK